MSDASRTRRRPVESFAPAAVALLAALVGLLPDYLVVPRALAVVPLLIWAPGAALVGPVRAEREAGSAARLLYAMGISLVLSVVVSVAWNWLPGGITGRSVVWSLAGLTLAALLLPRRRGIAADIDEAPVRRALPSWTVAIAGVVSLLLIGTAIAVSALAQVHAPTASFSELWLVRSPSQQIQVGIRNDEGRATDYRLIVLADGTEVKRQDGIHLDSGQMWQGTIGNPTGVAQLKVQLFRSGDTSPYRTTVLRDSGSSPPS